MKRALAAALRLALLASPASCVSDAYLLRDLDEDAASGDASGSAGPLRVEGLLQVSRELGETAMSTFAQLRLSRGGQPVEGAWVALLSGADAVVLPRGAAAGTYETAIVGYAQRYVLEVANTGAGLRATLEGPAMHYLDWPTPGARIPAGVALQARWSPAGAASALVQTRDLYAPLDTDPGGYLVPGSVLAEPAGQARADFVLVVRAQSVSVAGAEAGSTVRFVLRGGVPCTVEGG